MNIWGFIILGTGILIGFFLYQQHLIREIQTFLNQSRQRLGLGEISVRPTQYWISNRWLWLQRSEIEDAERKRDLRAENTQFVLSALLQGMAEGVLVLDAQQRVRATNQALQPILGFQSDIVGLSLMESFRNASLHDLVQDTLTRKESLQRKIDLASPLNRSLEVHAKAIKDGKGETTGVVLVFHDLTRLRHLESSRKDFVANVSHEIRTPLSIITGYIETLQENPTLDSKQVQQFLGVMARHAERISALVTDLLVLARLEAKESPLELKPLDLRLLIDQACADFQAASFRKNIRLQTQCPAPLPKILGDAMRLQQVYWNLLDNALRYSAPGSTIQIGGQIQKGSVCIYVKDQGYGISETDLPHIFERFYRADKSRSRHPQSENPASEKVSGGTGLGLSIVKEIIDLHGGRAWAESEMGVGSTFYFSIPEAPPSSAAP